MPVCEGCGYAGPDSHQFCANCGRGYAGSAPPVTSLPTPTATTSYVSLLAIGIGGLFCFPVGLVAAIRGHAVVRTIDAAGGHPDRWMAVVARALGVVGVTVFVGGFVFLLASGRAREGALVRSGKAMGHAFLAYAVDNDNMLPMGDEWQAIKPYAAEEILHFDEFVAEFPGSTRFSDMVRPDKLALGHFPGKLGGNSKNNMTVLGDGSAKWEPVEGAQERFDESESAVTKETIDQLIGRRWRYTKPMDGYKYTNILDLSKPGLYIDQRIGDFPTGRTMTTEIGKYVVRPDGLIDIYPYTKRMRQVFIDGKEVKDKKVVEESFEGDEPVFSKSTQIPVAAISNTSFTIQTLREAGSEEWVYYTYQAIN